MNNINTPNVTSKAHTTNLFNHLSRVKPTEFNLIKLSRRTHPKMFFVVESYYFLSEKAKARRGIAIATSMNDEAFTAKNQSLSGRKDILR